MNPLQIAGSTLLLLTQIAKAQDSSSVPADACELLCPDTWTTTIKTATFDNQWDAKPFKDPDFVYNYYDSQILLATRNSESSHDLIRAYYRMQCINSENPRGITCRDAAEGDDGKLSCSGLHNCTNNYGPQETASFPDWDTSSNFIREWKGFFKAEKTGTIVWDFKTCNDFAAGWFGSTKAFGCNGYDNHDYGNAPPTFTCTNESKSVTLDVVEGYVYPFRVLYVNPAGDATFDSVISQDGEGLFSSYGSFGLWWSIFFCCCFFFSYHY